jgi:hypothetical protein
MAAKIKWADKDPDEVLDYTHDWSAVLLDGDAVVGPPVALVDSGEVTVVSSVMQSATVQRVRLSEGVAGPVKLTIRINATSGQKFDEGVTLKIKER